MYYCEKCGSKINNDQKYCPVCGAAFDSVTAAEEQERELKSYQSHPDQYQSNKSMGWYKFLIYFSLFAGAAINAIQAFKYFTGTQYGEYSSEVYEYYSGLRLVDYFYSILLLGIAGLQIFTRFQLSGYKKNAPKYLIACYVAGIAVTLIYCILAMVVSGQNVFYVSAGSLVGQIVMICVNAAYFNNRKELFVN